MKNENYPKKSFMEYYNNEVKELAVKCAEGYRLMYDVEAGDKKPDCPEMDALAKAKKDLMAVWYIGLMIGDIERANIKGIRLDFINGISAVHGTLTSESYWADVWQNDFSSEEAKNLRELGEKMKVLIAKM